MVVAQNVALMPMMLLGMDKVEYWATERTMEPIQPMEIVAKGKMDYFHVYFSSQKTYYYYFFGLLPLEEGLGEAATMDSEVWLLEEATRAICIPKLPSLASRFLMVLSASLRRERQLSNESNGSWF